MQHKMCHNFCTCIILCPTEVFSDDQYRDRLQQFNEDSPANLSLLISDLREEDEGEYSCQTEEESRDFRLYVQGEVKNVNTYKVLEFMIQSQPCFFHGH